MDRATNTSAQPCRTVLHLVDGHDPLELQLALRPLLDRLPQDTWRQLVLPMGRGVPQGLSANGQARQRWPAVQALAPLEPQRLQHIVQREAVGVVHAWSIERARAAVLAVGDSVPVVLTMWDPYLDTARARDVHMLERVGQVTVLCHAQHVARRWVERGLRFERCVVVRPGVDFAQLNRHRRDPQVGQDLELSGQRIVLMPPARTRRDGLLFGVWATSAAQYLLPDLRVLMPGASAERERVWNRVRRLPNAFCLCPCPPAYTFQALLPWADAVLVPADEDISTTPLAWAMAAGVPIVACATYSISELIANGVNGLLVKPGEPMQMAEKLRQALSGSAEIRRLSDAARGQAFEAFGMSRYVEQVRHAYDNLLEGRLAGQGMTDSAIDAR